MEKSYTIANTYDEGVIINGIKWATRNVDKFATFAETPESCGEFYQWNEKTPLMARNYSTLEHVFRTDWEEINDPSPKGWRIPTVEEFEHLLDESKVKREWITQNGVNGMKFTDINSGNSVFFPAEGVVSPNGIPCVYYKSKDEGCYPSKGIIGSYRSSSRSGWQSEKGWTLFFYTENSCEIRACHGWQGRSIRCVAKTMTEK